MAITMKSQGMDPATALALSFPFAVAFQFLITATYTFATGLTQFANKGLEQGNFTKFKLVRMQQFGYLQQLDLLQGLPEHIVHQDYKQLLK